MLVLFNSESDLITGERLLKKRTRATIVKLSLMATDQLDDLGVLRVRNLDELRAWLRSARRSVPTRFVLASKTEFDQRRRTMSALASMGVQFSHLLSSGQDQIFVLDREQRMVAFFGHWPAEAPWKVKDLLGKRKRDIFPPEISAVHDAATLRALKGEEAAYEWSISKSARPVHLFTSASPLRNDGGAIAGVLLVTRDVTTLKEAQLRLERVLKEKTSQLLEIEGGVKHIAASFQRGSTRQEDHLGTSGLHTREFLTTREYSILSHLRKGSRVRSIAQTLGISVETVRRHVKAMFRKTGVHSQEALIRLFSEPGDEPLDDRLKSGGGSS